MSSGSRSQCVITVPQTGPYLEFVLPGTVLGGRDNRMDATGGWLDAPGSEDAHGRALWGLGHDVHRRAKVR